ncbi:methyltransferase-like protein 17, mitochondrial [Punica granatum]|uniref:Uncharacterized protein n=2 Tax=Punica granatum TaxID=22663 RepID=A0A218XJP9_PUNGR|nr:methyltransferase-like protein 17, mitochondrial [Punica granatum]OWM85187.1 hypothetical protein CDL15_Pgr027974 [Punica granatum]PKI51715.1 hypothetical protein CRG98_027878 [Punica granatum]
MAALIPETAKRIFTPETLRSAAKQSQGCLVVPVRLRRAIKKYLREQEEPFLKRKVLRLSASFCEIKDVNLHLTTSTSKELVEDPFKSLEGSKRWKIKSAYGDIGLKYQDDETVAYVASRMPAVYSACYRVLKEVRRRLSGFSPARVLDFGAGTGSAFWALRDVWPQSLERVNLVEPSQSMQRAGRSLIQGAKNLPLIHSFDSIQSLSKNIEKSERQHDLVIASYVLGEIPSLQDRITIVRQLWDLTGDVLVLVEPGTPHGSKIISQMRSHILWMEKRKFRKSKGLNKESKDLVPLKTGAFVVAPCPHDGPCPLEKTGKYCHFVQRLERTSSQRAYKRSKGEPLRGFEDEKFCYVAFRRGQRPGEPWPLDGMTFETLKEQHAKRKSEDLEIDLEDLLKMQTIDAPSDVKDPVLYESDILESDINDEINDDGQEEGGEEETTQADLGGGWGRIIFSPVRRGRQVAMDVCRSTKRDGSEGAFEHIVVTKSKNPMLHHQARRSLWGDLWPF